MTNPDLLQSEMNTQTTLEPETQTDDLVLRFVGGKNEGDTVSISTECCLLGITRNAENQDSVRDQCAIYRGSAGVAVQSHGAEVLINGEAKSVHWLQVGDRIQLSTSKAVEVVQLGSVGDECETTADVDCDQDHETNEAASAPDYSVEPVPAWDATPEAVQNEVEFDAGSDAEPVAESVDVAGDRIDFVNEEYPEEHVAENNLFKTAGEFAVAESGTLERAERSAEQPQEPEPTAEGDLGGEFAADEFPGDRFESLETSVNELRDQAADVDRRFDRLEDSLSALTEHLENLAASSLSSASVETESAAPQAFSQQAVGDTFAPDDSFTPEPVDSSVSFAADNEAETQSPAADENYQESIASLFSDLAKEDEATERSGPTAEETQTPEIGSTDEEPLAEQVHEPSEIAGIESPATDGLESIAEALQQTAFEQSASAVAESDPVEEAVSAIELPQSDSEEQTTEPETSDADLEAAFANVAALASNVEQPTVEDLADSVVETEQLESAVLSDPAYNEPSEASVEETEVETPIVETAAVVETEDALPAEVPVAPVHTENRTESVAEIFARLQSGGSASDNVSSAPESQPADETAFEEIQASVSAVLEQEVTDVPTPIEATEVNSLEQTASPDQLAEPVLTEEPESVEPLEEARPADDVSSIMDRLRASIEEEESTESTVEPSDQQTANKEDSVDDYMSMLLSRMKNDSDQSEELPSQVSSFVTPAEEPQVNQEPTGPLTEEEFMPRQKAVPIKSLDKMRELANSTSRFAVQQSVRAQQEERKKSLILQSLSLGSLALAGLMFATRAYTAGIAFSIIFALTSGYLFYEILRPAKTAQTKRVVVNKKSTEAAEPSSEATD
jgi:uncharacterized coiled-coil protein SlyX